MYKKSLLYVGSTVGSQNISNNQFYSLGWNKLILHYKYGDGGRIWTFDFSAYNFYWLSSRALTNWIYSQIALTSTSDIMEYLAHGISLFNCRLSGVCPARKARAKSSNVQFPRLPPSVMFGPWGPFEVLPAKFSPWQAQQAVSYTHLTLPTNYSE